MASQLESLVLDILLRDRASDGLGRISKASDTAAGSTDTLNRKLEELGKKTARARVELAGDKEAQASLDRIDVKLLSLDRRTASANLKVEGAARALAEISAVDLELDRMGGKGGTAERATASLGSSGLSGAAGMGALIGAGVALSPVIATLGTGLAGFGLAAYGVAKPIADAASKTGGLAANMKHLDPEQKAVALGILNLGKQYDQFQKMLKPEVLGVFSGGLRIASHLLSDIEPVAAATGKAFNILLGRLDAEFQSGQWQSFFSWMAAQAAPDMKLLGDALISVMNDIPPLLQALQPLATALLQVTNAAAQAGGALLTLDPVMHKQAAQGGFWSQVWHDFGSAMSFMVPASDAAAKSISLAGDASAHSAPKVHSLAQQVNALTAAYSKALSPMLAYTGAEITQANDADALRAALKKSHDQVGLGTAAQRASFGAANTYIQDLLNTAKAAGASGQGIGAQIASIRGALPLLRSVKGGTRDYWAEVQALVGWLDRLRAEKLISERISISGSGQWATVQGGGHLVGPGGARGMYITAGTGPTADDVLVRASRGELIVPAGMVSAGAVDHLHGQIPGFAAGGIIGSYGGPLKGLQPWGEHNWAATIQAITAGIAGALAGQFAAGGAPGGNPAVNAALARAMFPQYASGMNWAAWNYVAMRESGWNRFARNPSSGAYGIPQALPESKLPFAGQSRGGSSAGAQIAWMVQYMKSVYGGPVGAAVHESGFNWYDQGGWLPPGLSLAYNGTGRPERVGGGTTYVINVAVSPLARPADTGREVVAAIREHEKRAGRGWRTP